MVDKKVNQEVEKEKKTSQTSVTPSAIQEKASLTAEETKPKTKKAVVKKTATKKKTTKSSSSTKKATTKKTTATKKKTETKTVKKASTTKKKTDTSKSTKKATTKKTTKKESPTKPKKVEVEKVIKEETKSIEEEVPETVEVDTKREVKVEDVKEIVKAEEVKVEAIPKTSEEDKAEVIEEIAEIKEETKISQPLPEPELIDYLDSDVLKIKEVTAEELEQYSEEDEITIDSELEQQYSDTLSQVKENEICVGRVVNITDRDIFIDINFKSEGIVSKSEFSELPEIGDEVDVYVVNFENNRGQFILSKEKADFIKRWNEIKISYENGEIITGVIQRRIKGGMVVDLGDIFAFLPGSQIDVRPVSDFDEHVGQEYEFKVVKFNELRRNIVLSRKALLETDLKEKRQDIISQLEVGMILEGTVKNLTDFGAFVDLGGIDGLLHITDITWGRINHPSEAITIDEVVKVKVIDFDVEKTRVSLGMKQLEPEPWENAEEKYPIGQTVSGKIVNMMNYGVFIELEKGVEGLIHVSEMSWTRHIKHPNELFKLGDSVEAKILDIDITERKISLGIKQLQENPWENIETKYPIGSIHKGIVRNLTQFGAFVELEEGVDGLVHISDMSWILNVYHPKEVVKRGQEIDVKVLDASGENRRLALGIKQVQEDPWPELKTIYTSGKTVSGEIIRVLDKGIIFKLENDLEGIVPMKNLAKHERRKQKDKFKQGTVQEAIVQEIDREAKKVILMMDWGEDVENTTIEEKKQRKKKKEKVPVKQTSTSDKLEIPQQIIESIAKSEAESKSPETGE